MALLYFYKALVIFYNFYIRCCYWFCGLAVRAWMALSVLKLLNHWLQVKYSRGSHIKKNWWSQEKHLAKIASVLYTMSHLYMGMAEPLKKKCMMLKHLSFFVAAILYDWYVLLQTFAMLIVQVPCPWENTLVSKLLLNLIMSIYW